MKHYTFSQDAKAHLSEPEKETHPATVGISEKAYQSLTTSDISLVEFILQSPLVGLAIDLSRDKSPNREIDL
jgi:hypothetical protein